MEKMTHKQEMQQLNMDKSRKVICLMGKDAAWIEDYLMTLKCASTRYTQIGIIKDMLIYMKSNEIIESFAGEEIENITTPDISRYLENLKARNSSKTLIHKIDVLTGFFNWLYEENFINRSPCWSIKKKNYREERADFKEIHIPSKEEMKVFMENISNIKDSFVRTREQAIVALFIGSGIRSDELIGLDIDDLYLNTEKPFIKIMQKGNLENVTTVYISLNCIDVLKEYLALRNKVKADTNAVFVSEKTAKRITYQAMKWNFDHNSEKTITPHMLRHLYGTMLYQKTKDLRLVADQLRHADVNITRQYYVKGDDEKLCNTVGNFKIKY